MYQPYTTDNTVEGLKRARNAMRTKLWIDDVFTHQWLCHPDHACKDGCDVGPNQPGRFALYQSEIEE